MKKIMKNSSRFLFPFKGGKFNWVKIIIYALIAIIYLLRKFGIIQGDVDGLIQSLMSLFGL